MSTSPERSVPADDRILTSLSRSLAGHATPDDLRRELEEIGTIDLGPGQAAAVEELLAELQAYEPEKQGDVEMVVRETLEAVALGH